MINQRCGQDSNSNIMTDDCEVSRKILVLHACILLSPHTLENFVSDFHCHPGRMPHLKLSCSHLPKHFSKALTDGSVLEVYRMNS
jgi:hypothetical protein